MKNQECTTIECHVRGLADGIDFCWIPGGGAFNDLPPRKVVKTVFGCGGSGFAMHGTISRKA